MSFLPGGATPAEKRESPSPTGSLRPVRRSRGTGPAGIVQWSIIFCRDRAEKLSLPGNGRTASRPAAPAHRSHSRCHRPAPPPTRSPARRGAGGGGGGRGAGGGGGGGGRGARRGGGGGRGARRGGGGARRAGGRGGGGGGGGGGVHGIQFGAGHMVPCRPQTIPQKDAEKGTHGNGQKALYLVPEHELRHPFCVGKEKSGTTIIQSGPERPPARGRCSPPRR